MQNEICEWPFRGRLVAQMWKASWRVSARDILKLSLSTRHMNTYSHTYVCTYVRTYIHNDCTTKFSVHLFIVKRLHICMKHKIVLYNNVMSCAMWMHVCMCVHLCMFVFCVCTYICRLITRESLLCGTRGCRSR